jgi:hypothetical protein
MRAGVRALVLLAFAPTVLRAQSAAGPVVLQNPGSVRSAGLAGAGVALLGDAGAVFANPAGLALVHGISLEAGYHGAPFTAYQATAALGVRLWQFDLGAGLQYFDYGSEPEIVPDPANAGVTGLPTGGTVTGREMLASGSLIYRLGLLAFGGTIKGVDRQVADVRDEGVTGDLGLVVALFDIAALGFAVQNVGGNWENATGLTLPHLTRLGFTMNYLDPQETYRLLTTLEVQWPEGADTRVLLGVEGGVVVSGVGVLVRGAYGTRPSGAALSSFTGGASITVGGMTFDYAFTPTALLGGGEHRVGLRLRV